MIVNEPKKLHGIFIKNLESCIKCSTLSVPSEPLIEIEKCSSNNNTVTIGWKLSNDSISVNSYRLEMDDGNNGKFRVSHKSNNKYTCGK